MDTINAKIILTDIFNNALYMQNTFVIYRYFFIYIGYGYHYWKNYTNLTDIFNKNL